MPDPGGGSIPPETARAAGIDAAVLERLLGAMAAADRDAIRVLCARDLDRTRRAAAVALRDWDPGALARHLHVMTSLAQTVGAEALAAEAAQMQSQLRAGAETGYGPAARRMDDLARQAVRFLSETAR